MRWTYRTCFRPLSGSYISQLKKYNLSKIMKRVLFPSPIGELHFSIERSFDKSSIALFQFPSPIGELHFSIAIRKSKKFVIHGFRPLSGSYISQFIKQFDICCCLLLFPSPIGELHFSMHDMMSMRDYEKDSFRPLSGSYISQLGTKSTITGGKMVSVPYRGATFLNDFKN